MSATEWWAFGFVIALQLVMWIWIDGKLKDLAQQLQRPEPPSHD